MTRKAYSPIRILHSQFLPDEKKVLLVLENRFCHTDLAEVRVEWKCGGLAGTCCLPKAAPGKSIKAVICLEEETINLNEKSGGADYGSLPLQIAFYDANGERVDELVAENRESGHGGLLRDMAAAACAEAPCGTKLSVTRTERETLLQGRGFTIAFCNDTGLLSGLWSDAKRLLMGGPVLNVPYMRLGEWYLTTFEAAGTPRGAEVLIRGGYRGTLEITWKIEVRPDGEFTTEYSIERMEKSIPRQLKLRVGVDCGGLDELGVAYLADPSMDTLSWKRLVDLDKEGAYLWYPADHISRNLGTADRFSKGNVWGQQPEITWGEDMKNDIPNGYYDVEYKGTNDFRSTKEDVEEAYLYSGRDDSAIAVLGETTGTMDASGPDGRKRQRFNASVRLEVVDPEEWKITDRDGRIQYTGIWYPVEDKKESDHGTEMWSHEKGAAAECTFAGTGVVWYGPQDTTYGMADVYIDGRLVAHRLSQRVAGVDFPCSSVGYDKKYHIPIFSITDLPYGEHTIRIEVCGEKEEDASDYYIVIDYLRVLNGERTEPVKLIINQKFSFPHLSWGNYRKPPILLKEGTWGRVHMKALSLKGVSVREKIDEKIKQAVVF